VKINGVEVHSSVTPDRVMGLVEQEMSSLENPGICIACGEDADGCEPDAERYKCEGCGQMTVYGAEALMIRMV